MAICKLIEYVNSGEFEIIDEWNHQYIETMPRDEALAKYGDCPVWGHYTAAISRIPDGNGKVPSFKTAVWLDIPGMRIGYSKRTNLHLRFIGDDNEATFVGEKSGQLLAVERYGADDYSVWWRDESERDNETAGCSVRGTAEQIIKELEGEI